MRTDAALEFLDYCAAEPDAMRVIERFIETIAIFGFEVTSAGAWVGAGGAKHYRFYFNNWPKDWFEFYETQGFFLNDPMVLETQRRMTPFLWTEMTRAHSFTVEGANVIKAATAYGWAEVMGIPIHGPASYQGLVTVASLTPVTMTPTERALLRTMAVAVHDRAHESVGLGQPEVKLTAREAECMRWVAGGKTDAEIGIILGIAPVTAHYHIEQVKKKLGSHSRTESVALLVLAGIV